MSNTPALPPINAADAEPARLLQLELTTRIATQSLHYRSGEEETAARSVYTLFGTTRELLTDHPQAAAFETAAVFVLNTLLRPHTARWHRWMVEERFPDERTRRQFRYELKLLQPRLLKFAELLRLLAQGSSSADKAQAEFDAIAKSTPSAVARAQLGGEVIGGIGNEVAIKQGPLGGGLGTFATVADINQKEAEFIRSRREKLGLKSSEGEVRNLTGLCLSGGGIRSATFCLGIVQVLARQGLLRQFDYLSTVSGGGYLGTFLSAVLGTPKNAPSVGAAPESAKENPPSSSAKEIDEAFTDVFHEKDGHESAALRHLRNNSRYLLNGGPWGRVKIAGLLITGILTNILLMLPLPLIGALLVVLLNHGGYWGHAWPQNFHDAGQWPAVATLKWLALLLGSFWIALPIVRNIASGHPAESAQFRFRAGWESAALLLGLATLATGALAVLPAVFHAVAWVRDHADILGPTIRKFADSDQVVTILTAVLPLVSGLFAARLGKSGGKGWSTLLFGLSGPILYLAVFVLVGSRMLAADPHEMWPWEEVFWITLSLTLWSWLFVNINDYSPHGYYRARLCECYLAVRGEEHLGWRRRLTRWFVSGWKKKGPKPQAASDQTHHPAIGARLRLPLSTMNESLAAPYHLVNTAANLPASREPNLRGRDCDFFVFSRDFCGGPVCGYVETSIVEKLDPHIDLGTAMAISGAAASSNMGVKTLREMRFLITLLNVRLGYWLRNPAKGPRFPIITPGPFLLFREMMGWMHENSGYTNLSDGGHIENLALYELLRRRCKFIVVVDGGMEPGMECADLMLAQRYAQIDLGVQFDFDIADLALDPSRRSRAYAVFGKIRYAPRDGKGGEDLGWMVYLKLSCTGGEPGYVADYRRQFPDFPHQTTGDQIYDEAQFEAYRRLGECAAESLFRGELAGDAGNPQSESPRDPQRFKNIDGWFQALANNLLPDNDPAFDARPE
jgi:hypothetical protein